MKSRILTIVSLCAILMLGATTFMPVEVYGSWWFVSLMALAGIALTAGLFMGRMWRSPASGLLHLSLVIILAGGGITWLTSSSGSLKLAPGDTATSYLGDDGRIMPLPEPVRLLDFSVDTYPGAMLPRDFRSTLLCGEDTVRISMNNVGSFRGIRFYQQGYDSRGATELGVRHDVAGTAVTYAGYIAFLIAAIWLVAAPGDRFRRLLRGAAALLVLAAAQDASAAGPPSVPTAQADSLATRQVTYNGRVVPLHTVARDFSLKLTGSARPGGISPVQFMLSVMLYPQEWSRVPFIKVKSGQLAEHLGVEKGYLAPAALFDDSTGAYRLAGLYHGGATGLDREILDLDGRMELLLKLRDGTLFAALGEEDTPRPEWSIHLEILYHTMQLWRWLTYAAFLCALLSGIGLWRGSNLWWLAWIVAAGAALNFGCRWIISENVPLSSGHEVMQFLMLGFSLMTAIFGRRQPLLVPFGLLFSAFAGLVSTLGANDPAITALMPVLASPWLSVHVSLVMVSYAILLFTLPLSLIQSGRKGLLQAVNCAGVLLLGLGIFAGAVWANMSWGRYWGWDPKETWALVSMLLYSLPLHPALGFQRHPRLLPLYYLLCALSIAMTYFGVNYLPSLHAYQS